MLVYPEGTRVDAGSAPVKFNRSGAALAIAAGVPLVPIFHNAGRCWGRNAFIKRPGLVTLSIGAPIDPRGMSAEQLGHIIAEATGKPEQLIQLHRVGWVRSEITPTGEIRPSAGSQWANAQIDELRVPVQLSRHDDHEDVIRVTPLGALTPGLYTLSALPPAGMQARFGVRWPGVDQRSYAAAHCVDLYPGSPERYRTCAEQDLAIASRVLKVHLVTPETHNLPGQPRQLVVKGVVINTSDSSSRVPPLQGRLVNRQGVVIKSWEFLADTGSLAPGASVPFETRVTNPPVGASDVQVTFASFQPSLGQATGHTR